MWGMKDQLPIHQLGGGLAGDQRDLTRGELMGTDRKEEDMGRRSVKLSLSGDTYFYIISRLWSCGHDSGCFYCAEFDINSDILCFIKFITILSARIVSCSSKMHPDPPPNNSDIKSRRSKCDSPSVSVSLFTPQIFHCLVTKTQNEKLSSKKGRNDQVKPI